MSANKCILHFGPGARDGTIVKLCEESLEKCKNCWLLRGHSSKYKQICLPENVTAEAGYHVKCYSNFTAIKEKTTQKDDSQPSTSADSFSVLPPNKCVFCCRKEIKKKGKRYTVLTCTESDEFIQKLSTDAATINDEDLSKKINGQNQLLYHKICLANFEAKNETFKNKQKSSPEISVNHENKKKSLAFIIDFIEENVIQSQKSYSLRYLVTLYNNYQKELSGYNETDMKLVTVQQLERKIMKHFKGQISKHSRGGRQGDVIVFSFNMKLEDAVRKVHDIEKDDFAKIQEAAFILRSEIFMASKNSKRLPPNLSPQDIIDGEIQSPQLLSFFYEQLICGSKKNRNDKQLRKVKSFSDSTIYAYAVTNGTVKPSTLLQVGLTVKSLTSNKKLVQILNRLGYSINYNCVEELETELAYSYMQQNSLTPVGISKDSSEIVGVAWDNYDSYVDTQSGKGTMHDTVGICFQNKCEQRMPCEPFEPINEDCHVFNESDTDDHLIITNVSYEKPCDIDAQPSGKLDNVLPLSQCEISNKSVSFDVQVSNEPNIDKENNRNMQVEENDLDHKKITPMETCDLSECANQPHRRPDVYEQLICGSEAHNKGNNLDAKQAHNPNDDGQPLTQKEPNQEFTIDSESHLCIGLEISNDPNIDKENNQNVQNEENYFDNKKITPSKTCDLSECTKEPHRRPDEYDRLIYGGEAHNKGNNSEAQQSHNPNDGQALNQKNNNQELSIDSESHLCVGLEISNDPNIDKENNQNVQNEENYFDNKKITPSKTCDLSECTKEPHRRPDVYDQLIHESEAHNKGNNSEAQQSHNPNDGQALNQKELNQELSIDSEGHLCVGLEIEIVSEAYEEPHLLEEQLIPISEAYEEVEEPYYLDVHMHGEPDINNRLIQSTDHSDHTYAKSTQSHSDPIYRPRDEISIDKREYDEPHFNSLSAIPSSIDEEESCTDVQICNESHGSEMPIIHEEAWKETNKTDDNANQEQQMSQQVRSNSNDQNNLRRRRTLQPSNLDIQPYKKKPKMSQNLILIPSTDMRRHTVPNTYDSAILLERLWLLSLFFNKAETPMWVGWNSQLSKDSLSEHVITYLTQINRSPTTYDVVAETMRRSLTIAKECNQKYIIVTYDLAIAKMAFQIQSEDSPAYDNLFIMLGPFHIVMAFFKAIGKYIDCSGASDILSDSGLLAEGSMNGFILGTHYNRCKRLHTILAAAMSMLHFQKYLKDTNIGDDLLPEIKDILSNEKWMEFQNDEDNLVLRKILQDYDCFSKRTQNGDHGKTAQFWYTYIKFIELYHLFSRSVRSGDYKLYTFVIGKMCNIFFVMNQPNYARWLTKMHSNMCAMEETHPEIVEQFKKGALSLRRTSKHFARSAIDLTLEQTVNADAASGSKGVTALTNSIVARQRWAMTHAARTYIMSDFLGKLGLTKKEDVTPDLRPANIRKNQKDLDNLIEKITLSVNPFGDTVYENTLHNIITGKSTSEETMSFLLNIDQLGEDKKNRFIDECNNDPSRFEKPITRVKTKTFADETGTIKEKKDGLIVELKVERNFLGRLLCLAVEHNIDLKETFTYPITPAPLTFTHLDSSFVTTTKSTLLKNLEKKIESGQPSFVTATVVDGFFLLHTLGDLPATFGDIARYILVKIMKLDGQIIHIVFDNTTSPSIKDNERDRRSTESDRHRPYVITGRNMKRPNNFLKALRNDYFKKELVSFLAKEWEQSHHANIINTKLLYVTVEQDCYSFQRDSDNSTIKKEIVSNLKSCLEEADTRMFFHIAQTVTGGDVVIRTNDTDVLIIGLANLVHFSENVHLWLEMGLSSNNTHRYIDLNKLYHHLGRELSAALSAFHAFTGCDYVPAFYGKGKTRPLQMLEKNKELIDAFGQFGLESDGINSRAEKIIEKFVCQMYGMPRLNSVNEVRYQKFLKAYKPSSKSPFGNIKGINERTMPPCQRVLKQHILRVNFICGIWNHAYTGMPIANEPVNKGWTLNDGKYVPMWFEGDRIPSSLEAVCRSEMNVADNIYDNDDVDDDINNDGTSTDSDSDGEYIIQE